jgi:hypothetical protein
LLRTAAGIAGAVVLPVAGVVGGAVQVGRGIANQSEATQEKKKGRVWNKVGTKHQDSGSKAAAAATAGTKGQVAVEYLLLVLLQQYISCSRAVAVLAMSQQLQDV